MSSVLSGGALALVLTIAVQYFVAEPDNLRPHARAPLANPIAQTQEPGRPEASPEDADRIRDILTRVAQPEPPPDISISREIVAASANADPAASDKPDLQESNDSPMEKIPAAAAQQPIPRSGQAGTEALSEDSSDTQSAAPILSAKQDQAGTTSEPAAPIAEPFRAESGSHRSEEPQQLGAVAPAITAQLVIHYRASSKLASADAQRLVDWFGSSGFGRPELRKTSHTIRSPVIRYFSKSDADTAFLLVRELRKQTDNSWRAEDCTHHRHKPPPKTIEVWPGDAGGPEHERPAATLDGRRRATARAPSTLSGQR
jgi:hypothetical protein